MQKLLVSIFATAIAALSWPLGSAQAGPAIGARALKNAVPASTETEFVRWRGRGWGWGGVAAGAIIGGALASQYYYPRYYYPYAPGYYPPAYYPPPPPPGAYVEDDGIAYCMQRFKSYDPRSGTYLGYDGARHPCP